MFRETIKKTLIRIAIVLSIGLIGGLIVDYYSKKEKAREGLSQLSAACAAVRVTLA